MNTFSSLSQSETITSRIAVVLAVLVLASLPAVASANSVAKAELFSGAEVTQLSTEQMSETRGQWDFGSDQWEIAYALGDTSLTSYEIYWLIPPEMYYEFFIAPFVVQLPHPGPWNWGLQPVDPDPLCISAACIGNVGF